MAIKRILNVLPSKDQHKDWPAAAAPKWVFSTLASAPAEVDLRQTWWPVGSQGSTGACVGWSVGALAQYHLTVAGKLPQGTGISWRHIWMASKEEDVLWRPSSFIDSWGTYVKDALDITRKHGCVPLSVWPASNKTYTGSYENFYSQASLYKIGAYYNLGGGSPDAWMEWLSTQGPVVVRLDVDYNFQNRVTSTNPVLDLPRGTPRGGHAVLLVGYKNWLDGRKVFIVRNSWGKYWGDNGHAYATIPYATEAFNEAYGITL